MDEWVDLEAPAKAAAASEPVTIASVQLRHSAKISLSIAADVAAVIGWPRYRVAWNRDRKAFRVKADPMGSFEGFHPPRGRNAGESGGGRVIIRVPLPDDLGHVEGRHAAVHEIDKIAKVLIVRVPSRYWLKKP